VQASGGTFLSVTEAEIREAQRMILELEGIEACPSSSTTIAAARRMRAASEMGHDDVVLANLTGGLRETEVTPKEYLTLTKAVLLEEAPPRAAREAPAGDYGRVPTTSETSVPTLGKTSMRPKPDSTSHRL